MTQPSKTAGDIATERFNLIAPLIADDLDKGLRRVLMRKIIEDNNVSERTLLRYLKAWKEGGLPALMPKPTQRRPDCSLGASFERVVDIAIELRRESPSRSVADIIKILELEGAVEPGMVARSTLQRHLAGRGFSASQMSLYTSKGAAARRFSKEHRCQLWQSDVKFGPHVPNEKGRNKQVYLTVWIDDATRFIISARFYFDQKVNSLEDSFRRGIQKYGVPNAIFVDNGSQYRSNWFNCTCAKLGIRLMHSRPYHPQGKGLIERFNNTVTRFISELALAKPESLERCNELLRVWIEEHYHTRRHSGLAGMSPGTAFGMDNRPLRFVAMEQLRDAFLHTDKRKVDKTGCISFNGQLYEVGLAYIGRVVEIRFDTTWSEEIEVLPGTAEPFLAKKLVIGPNCGTTRELPEHLRTTPPQSSRLLDSLVKERQKKPRPIEVATSFKDLWEGDD